MYKTLISICTFILASLRVDRIALRPCVKEIGYFKDSMNLSFHISDEAKSLQNKGLV